MKLEVPGYTLCETLHSGKMSTIFRATRKADDGSVILKVPSEDQLDPNVLARLSHEFNLIHHLDCQGVRKAYSMENVGPKLVLILEDFGGDSLNNVMEQTRKDLNLFFEIAILLADTIGNIHHNNIIHKDIKPSNILVNVNSPSTSIIDFGIATPLSREIQQIVNPTTLEGTIAYMSPEQTGRMNRSIDYRSDIYSLGITFYEMITGQLPFQSDDAMELVHQQIAVQPLPPDEINSDIPPVLSGIIMKCMEKDAEKRYQSAFGLKNDLEECWRQFKAKGYVEFFSPGRHDVFDRFRLPSKLYGRKEEINLLLEAFERSSSGDLEFLLVQGGGGIGKTSLIHEIQKPVVRKRGYFASGKFEQFKKNVPYSAVSQALQGLIQQFLTESEKNIKTWKKRILTAVGLNGQLLIDFLPQLELVIGKQPPVVPLDLQNAESRLRLTFANFIEALLHPEHPLVIFLDDLQWVDDSTLKLLQFLVKGEPLKNLMMICAYRPEEVGEDHPLLPALNEIQKSFVAINHLKVSPLDKLEVTELIEDTCHSERERTKDFADLVYKKTGGNPFFVLQFLKLLYKDKLLDFDLKKQQWVWDLDSIEKLPATENVGQFMISKLQKLNHNTQQVLQIASAIGNRFDWKTLSNVSKNKNFDPLSGLEEAFSEELIFVLRGGNHANIMEFLATEGSPEVVFAFQHDRIQQAAYRLIDDVDRPFLHTEIGKFILQNTSEYERENMILDIVNQLNHGIELITETAEKKLLTELNSLAGIKAKEATAFLNAKQYFVIAQSLLEEDCWENEYPLSLRIHENLATCELMTGNLEKAEELFGLVIAKAKTKSEKASYYFLQINLYVSLGKLKQALNTLKLGLKLFGVNIELPPKKLTVERERFKTAWYLATKSLADLNEISESYMSDHYWIISFYAAAGYAGHKAGYFDYYTFIIANQVFQSGICEHTAMAMTALPVLYCSENYQKYSEALKIGEFLLKTTLKYPKSISCLQSRIILQCMIEPLRKHMTEVLAPVKDLERECMNFGLTSYASMCLTNLAFYSVLTGQNINWAMSEVKKAQYKLLRKYKTAIGNTNILFILEFCRAVSGKTDDTTDPCPKGMESILHSPKPDPSKVQMHYYVPWRVLLLYLNENYEEILSFGETVKSYFKYAPGHQLWLIYHCYYALGLAGACFDPEVKKARFKILLKYKGFLKSLAKASPINYLQKYYLLSGEIERIQGRYKRAEQYYQKAIVASRDNGYIYDEAISYELLGKCFLDQNIKVFAEIFIKQAYETYNKWGAASKMMQLRKKYEDMFLLEAVYGLSSDERGTFFDIFKEKTTKSKKITIPAFTGGESADISTIIPALQAISEEISLEALTRRLMPALIELTKASKAFFLLAEDHQSLWVISEMTNNIQVPLPFKKIPIDEKKHSLCDLIIVKVAKEKKEVFVVDPQNSAEFSQNSYVQNNHVAFILAIPLLYQGEIKGVLYFENSSQKNTFTPSKIKILKILSTQIAISLENAKFYHSLEQKVAERTTQLKESQKKLSDQAKMASLGLLTSGIAHEISNPLNLIINNAEISGDSIKTLEEYSEGEKALEIFKNDEFMTIMKELDYTIHSVWEHGIKSNSIVRNMLEQSEFGRGELISSSIHNLIESCINSLLSKWKKKCPELGIDLKLNFDEKLGNIVIIPHEISRVVSNILDNSIFSLREKWEEKGSIFIPNIEITTHNLGNTCEIRIRDNGKGISTDIQGRIFQPFVTTKPAGEGLGLALSLSHSIIVQKHEGRINIKSTEGIFTEITITLPISRPTS